MNRRSETIALLAPALAAAQAEFSPIAKDRENPHYGNRYATLDAIMDMVRPVLTRHGLTVLHDTDMLHEVKTVEVTTALLHKSGEWVGCAVAMPIEKLTAQGVGSAITYGRRYGLGALLGITADEDDDGNAASQQERPARAQPRQQSRREQPKKADPPPAAGDGQKEQPAGELTLEAAHAITLPGRMDSWNGNGQKPIGEVTDEQALIDAGKWMDEKDRVGFERKILAVKLRLRELRAAARTPEGTPE
jgi:hypothetical protein